MAQYGEVRVDYITYTTGTVPTEANATVTVSSLVNDPTFSGDVQVGGDVTITGNLNVSGDSLFDGITVSGNSILNTLTVTGGSNLEDVEISGTLTVTGNTNLNNLTVTGNTNVNNLTVTGITVLDNLVVSGDTTVSGDLTVEGDINASGVTILGITGLFASGTAGAPSISFVDDTDTGFYNPSGNFIGICTSGTERLTIDDNGNVGIGTSNPDEKLHINSGDVVIGQQSGASTDIRNYIKFGRARATKAAIGFINSASNGRGALLFMNSNASDADAFTDADERMRIEHDGNVGIGTSNPVHNLQVSSDSGTRISITSSGDNTGPRAGALVYTFSDGDGAGIQASRVSGETAADVYLTFRTGGSTNNEERVRIQASGNVGIGTTNPNKRLHVVSDENTVGTIESTNTQSNLRFVNSTGNNVYVGTTNGNNFIWSIGGSERARIDLNGRLLIGISTARNRYAFGSVLANPLFQVEGTGAMASFGITRNINNAKESVIFLGKTRGASVGENTIVQSDDRVGTVSFNAADGTNLIPAAKISAEIDGTPGDEDMPGRLLFATTADGDDSPTERLRINNSGAFGVAGENFGTAGQVLVSNGSSAAPSWEQITPSAVFGWDHDNDNYGLYLPGTSIRVSNLTGTVDIDVQSRIRRCVINDSGVVQYYLDADDSDLRSGDWLRIVETEALDTDYTGTISESTNSLLRVNVAEWEAATYTLSERVTYNGSLWECVAATTTETPGAGTVASDLTGTDGQVVVEVPAFSVRYGFLNGVHTREVRLGCSDSLIAQGFQPHPAFIKTDGTYKDAFYIGAYHTYNDAGTGSSVSGQINTRSQSRPTFRNQAENRGTGWHLLSYLEMAAIQTLLVCEFQDYNSQKVLGNGADNGATYGVTTGQNDGNGNHSVNSVGNLSDADDYMAYRGIENLYGRSWQWVDGINVHERVVYLTNDQTAFEDNTADGYEVYAQLPFGSAVYQKELYPLPDVFLPSVVSGGSATTYLADGFWSAELWRVARVGGNANDTTRAGVFSLRCGNGRNHSASGIGSRLCYAVN